MIEVLPVATAIVLLAAATVEVARAMRGHDGTAAECAALAAAPPFFALVGLAFVVAQAAGWLAPLHLLMARHELLPLRIPILLALYLYLAFVLFAFAAVGPRRGYLRGVRLFGDALFSFLYTYHTPAITLFAADLARQAHLAGNHPLVASLPALLLPALAPCTLPLAARLAVPMRRRPDFEAEARDLFLAAGVVPPVIREAAFRAPFHNGFTFGNRATGHLLALTAASADQLNPRERRAIFAHEAGHLAAGDLDRHLLAAASGGLLFAIALALLRFAGLLPAASGLAVALLALACLMASGAAVHRDAAAAEERADAFAVERGLAAPLLSALGKIWGCGPIDHAVAARLAAAQRRRVERLLDAAGAKRPAGAE